MADLKNWPWALNQLGYDYPAEIVRSQHYSATSGGNGVSSPTAMKVEAQTAPDGTVRIRPGGSDVVSTYPGQEEQTYYSPEFQSKTLTVSPTGSSSGGRTDLIVRRVLDPDHEAHPEHSGEMTEEAAQDLDFQWYELIQGATASTKLSYPHVKLAEIRRPANTTIVNSSHIVDLRVLSDPKTLVVPMVKNIGADDTHTAGRTGNYNTLAEFSVDVPDFATTAVVDGTLAGCFVRHPNGGVTGNFDFDGLGSYVGGSQGDWQQTGWSAPGSVAWERLDFHAGGEVEVEPARRGTTQRVRLRVRIPTTAPDGTQAGTENQSLAKLTITFKQGVL